ncbi:hypothetical protein ACLOJK_031477 [Asimina triloba]
MFVAFVVGRRILGQLSGKTKKEVKQIDRLLALLVEEACQAERSGRPFPLTIVFVERKVLRLHLSYVHLQTRCDEVAEALVAQGLHAVALHGGRSQSEREAALRDFRSGSTNILVATDVASRGLDVTGVAHVVNLDLPKSQEVCQSVVPSYRISQAWDASVGMKGKSSTKVALVLQIPPDFTMEDYVHRIGRTGRAGSTGQATSFYTDRDMFLVAHIRKAITDAETGNSVSYATGKVARRKEREAAAAQKEARITLSKLSLNGPTSINVEDKYKYMLTPTSVKKEGAADDAWDD